MGVLRDLPPAALAAFRLLIGAGAKLRGDYYAWRWHTAFGRGVPESKREMLRGMIAYLAWSQRIRSGR
ncbi:MAG: hypothetical protein AAFX79_06020 [Planctomycetota bacterium]